MTNTLTQAFSAALGAATGAGAMLFFKSVQEMRSLMPGNSTGDIDPVQPIITAMAAFLAVTVPTVIAVGNGYAVMCLEERKKGASTQTAAAKGIKAFNANITAAVVASLIVSLGAHFDSKQPEKAPAPAATTLSLE